MVAVLWCICRRTMTTTQHTADDDRTETKRFDAETTDDLVVTDLREGDRIDPALVAGTMDFLGETRSTRPDAPTLQLAVATITHGLDDVHTAILVDGETGAMVRASRHDSQSAWTQKEADWKVRDIGDTPTVVDAEWDGADPDDADTAAASWAEVVLCDRACGHDDYEDEVEVDGQTIKMRNPWECETARGTLRLE